MLKRKFGNSGNWILDGQELDGYKLLVWLQDRYDATGEKVYPSRLTEELARQCLADGYRYHRK